MYYLCNFSFTYITIFYFCNVIIIIFVVYCSFCLLFKEEIGEGGGGEGKKRKEKKVARNDMHALGNMSCSKLGAESMILEKTCFLDVFLLGSDSVSS